MPLFNSFITSIVSVGFNSERGLVINGKPENSSPFLSLLQPYVLAIITADQALYPQSKQEDTVDESYPPILNSNASTLKKCLKSNEYETELCNSLPVFCFPDGVKLSYQKEESHIHHIVFTQQDGIRSYAIVLTFQQKFTLKSDNPNDNGTYDIEFEIDPPKQNEPSIHKQRHTVQRVPSSYNSRYGTVSNGTQLNNSNGITKTQYQDDQSNSSLRTSDSSNASSTSRMSMRPRSGSCSSLHNLSNRRSTGITYDSSEPFYLPHCIVLVSANPYWTAMQELVSIIYDDITKHDIQENPNIYKSLLQKYAFLACNTPVPPLAWERFSLSLCLKFNQSILTFDPPLHMNRPVLDLDLSRLLLTLNIGKLIEVLSAMFTQQPIIFFSSDYAKLVTTLECLLYLIYPLKWFDTYIPILPDSLHHILEGPPGAYIMGAHIRHRLEVEARDSCLTCNLDDDRNIQIPSTVVFRHIPSTKLQRFITPTTQFIEQIKNARSLQNVHAPIRVSLDKQRADERKHRLETNEKIIEIFLDLMVDLFEDVFEPIYWTMDHQQKNPIDSSRRSSTLERNDSIHKRTKFNKEIYLSSKTDEERQFYELLISTTAFQLFIQDEIQSESQTEFHKICELRSQINQDLPLRSNRALSTKSSSSSVTMFDTPLYKVLLQLPDWTLDTSTHYLDDCIEVFEIELENAKRQHSSALITVFGYLSGCALLGRGHLLDGLRDLYLIENPNLFPKNYIQTVILSFLVESGLLNTFLNEIYYIKSPTWKKIQTDGINKDEFTREFEKSGTLLDDISFDSKTTYLENIYYNYIENNTLFEQFNEDVHHLHIVYDRETSEVLFKALLHWIDIPNATVETKKQNRRWSLSSTIANGAHNQKQNTLSRKPTLPTTLLKLFLQTWERTNAENEKIKVSYLSKEQQKQETILMISSPDIISKRHNQGKLILTQRAIYFLPNGHSTAQLLTELLKIVYIEPYTQKAILSSTLGIRIYAVQPSSSSTKSSTSQPDAEAIAVLIFKDNREQNFWYTIIKELWIGVSIAQEQCDTMVFYKIARHIALINTIINIDYNEGIPPNNKQTEKATAKAKPIQNQGNLDAVLQDFTIFTRMHENGTVKALSEATRKALYHRLSPSLNETERHAVRCLVCNEHSESDKSLLWCSYGQKLKIFNTLTWKCDPSHLCFPSLITCMCLDYYGILWIGCIDGQLFIVNTAQRMRGTQIAVIEGKGGCQTMIFDINREQMLIGTQSGLILIWDIINKQRLFEINLEEIFRQTSNAQGRIFRSEIGSRTERPTIITTSLTGSNEVPSTSSNTLKSIQIYGNRLFACYRDDEIRIYSVTGSNTYIYEDKISVKYKNDSSMPINSFYIYNQQLWISASCYIYIYSINHEDKRRAYQLIMKKPSEDDHLLTMLGFSDHIWAGSSRGNVYVYRMDNFEKLKTFDGHKDGVCCLCPMSDKYVISGSQQHDTSIVIWENIQTNGNLSTTRL